MITLPVSHTIEASQRLDFTTAQVNFESLDDINGFASLLCRHASDCGLFVSGLHPSAHIQKIKTAAREWITEVNRRLPMMSPGDAFSIMSGYDIVHRIAFNASSDPRFINRHVIRAFDAMIAGDETVDSYAMYRHITAALRGHDKTYLGRPLQWTSACLDQWYNRFKTALSRPFTQPNDKALTVGEIVGNQHATPYDHQMLDNTLGNHPEDDYHTIEQVSCLLISDLWAYETRNEDRFKRHLFDRHRHYLDHLDGYNLSTLHALSTLLTASLKFIDSKEFDTYKTTLFQAHLSHPNTNQFQKATLLLPPQMVDERTAS